MEIVYLTNISRYVVKVNIIITINIGIRDHDMQTRDSAKFTNVLFWITQVDDYRHNFIYRNTEDIQECN